MRRLVAVLAVILGVGLIVAPFVLKLPSRTAAAERTFDRFDGLMSERGLAQARVIFDTTSGGGLELVNRGVPTFARQLNMTPEEFGAFVRQNFPAVATGVQEVPGIVAFVGPIIRGLEMSEDDFEAADSIPGLGLPLTATTWLAVALGLAFVVAGILALRRPSRAAMGALLAVAVVAAVVPFVLGLPQKTRDARELGDVARMGLSREGAKRANDGVLVLAAMTEQIRRQMLPALAQRLGVTPAQLNATLARDFPAITRYLTDYDRLRAQAAVIVRDQQGSVEDFAKADEIPVRTLPWLLIVPGAILALLAGISLATGNGGAARYR